MNRLICSDCKVNPPRYKKGEFVFCLECYPAVKGLWTKAEIEAAIAARATTREVER